MEVENLSAYGLRGSGPLSVARGDWVSIELPDLGPVTARIAWTKGDRFGARFRDKIDLTPRRESSRGLFEIVTGLPIRLQDSVWSAGSGDVANRKGSGTAIRSLETDRERAERLARTTKVVQDYIRERKRERAERGGSTL